MNACCETAIRRHGKAPYTVLALHGGPGAVGTMAPVARRLATTRGVLEPWQEADSVGGLVEETCRAIADPATPPVLLIGHFWGAWLALLVAARVPTLVAKVVLVGCPPLREADAADIMATRLARLDRAQRERVTVLEAALARAADREKGPLWAEFGALLAQSDVFCPIAEKPPTAPLPGDGGKAERIWQEASALRRSGELLRRVGRIVCPVVAVHGSFDPHPWAGVAAPLSEGLPDFRLIVLERCGHTPWLEQWAQADFFRILREELA